MISIRKKQSGFTLIELMIVISIIGVLAAVAIPAYETYSARSQFSEVILAASTYKSAAEVAVQMGRAGGGVASLNAGSFGIPSAITSGNAVGRYVDTVTMVGGLITATSTNITTNATYTLQAAIVNRGVLWTVGGGCVVAALC